MTEAEAPLRVGQGDCILQGQVPEASVDFFAFDKTYVERLRNGDAATEHHFFVYFEKLLHIKLRSRVISSDKVDDLKQETFIRVIAAVRKEGAVRQPERFGAFVNSICNNVLMEYYRTLGKNQQMDETHAEIPDKVLDLEGMMVSKQSSEHVRKILSGLPARDRDLLRAVFLEDKDKDAVCRDIGVDRGYLRVLLHRAKDKFKAVYEKEQFGGHHRVTGNGN
jgi:RNA polymerase sigma-70 factor, ECF subfamily